MLHIVINPATGSGRGRRIFEKIRPMFDTSGVDYAVHYSSPEKTISDIVRKMTSANVAEGSLNPGIIPKTDCDEPVDIVIVGGDGSMNEAVNGIGDFDNVRLGFIPAGSGNDLARALGLKQSSKGFVQEIIKAHKNKDNPVRSIDIGVAECDGKKKLFNISAGMGFDAETCYFADRSGAKCILNKLGLGKMVYISVALRLIIKNEKFCCKIVSHNGSEKVYTECLFAVGMNHRYEGGGFMFCPDASDTDGRLDLCVVDGVGPIKFLGMFPTALSGRHIKFKEISIFRDESATITTHLPCHVHMDGEAGQLVKELKLSVCEKKLQLLV